MAATVEFSETNGSVGSPTTTDGISNINFGSTDAPNITTTSHPIIIGGYSYTKWIQFHVSAMGGSSSISNLRFYKQSGVYVTGETIGGSMSTAVADRMAGYGLKSVNAGGGSISPFPYNGSGSGLMSSGSWANWPASTSLPSSNVPISNSLSGVLSAPGYSNLFAIALVTTASTPSGAVNQKVFAMTWDEV